MERPKPTTCQLSVDPGAWRVPSHLAIHLLPGDAGPTLVVISLHWADDSLVLLQGDLSVCPVRGRPAAWLEEKPRTSVNSGRNQTGGGLLQQNRNRYCSARRARRMLSFFLLSF